MATLVRMKAQAARLAYEDELAMGGTYPQCYRLNWDQVVALLEPALAAAESKGESPARDAASITRACSRAITKLQQCSWAPEDEGPINFLLTGCACLWLGEGQVSLSPANARLVATIITGTIQREKSSLRSELHASNKRARAVVASMQSLLASKLDWYPEVRSNPR